MRFRTRRELDRVDPYRPGRRASLGTGSLASNESPLGTSPNVVAAVTQAMTAAHRYPDPLAGRLRMRLAEIHRVDAEQILVGNGSDELVYLLMWAFVANGGCVVCADPAYRLTEVSAYVAGAEVRKIPLVDWTHDLDGMATVQADLAYVCNPNNPTGTIKDRGAIEQFLARSPAGLVVVDEAYIDFTDNPDGVTVMPLAARGELAVLRTFSKAYGLAGLRVGYLISSREVISLLRKIRPPFSVNTAAQAAAAAALADQRYRSAVRSHVIEYRGRLTRLFEDRGYPVVASQANFILVQPDDENGLVNALASGGVSVRRGSDLGVPGMVRVTVPSPEGFRLLAGSLPPRQGTPSISSRGTVDAAAPLQ